MQRANFYFPELLGWGLFFLLSLCMYVYIYILASADVSKQARFGGHGGGSPADLGSRDLRCGAGFSINQTREIS